MAVFSLLFTFILTTNAIPQQPPPKTEVIPEPGINALLDGTYQWHSADGIISLYICTGLGQDKYNVYAGIERDAKNAYYMDDGVLSFFNIIARAKGIRVNGDGITATFEGFRAADSVGIDKIYFTVIYSKCDKLYQLEFNDETYTLRKMSLEVSDGTKCWRPGRSSFKDLPKISQFESGALPFNPSVKNINTYIRDDYDDDDMWACWERQDMKTGLPDKRHGKLYGSKGPYGSLEWENRLIIESWDDDGDDDDDKQRPISCKKGIEFVLKTDDGIYCSSRCVNQPTVGYSGKMKQVPLKRGYTSKECPKYGKPKPTTTKEPKKYYKIRTNSPTKKPKKPKKPVTDSPTIDPKKYYYKVRTNSPSIKPVTDSPSEIPKKKYVYGWEKTQKPRTFSPTKKPKHVYYYTKPQPIVTDSPTTEPPSEPKYGVGWKKPEPIITTDTPTTTTKAAKKVIYYVPEPRPPRQQPPQTTRPDSKETNGVIYNPGRKRV